MDLPGAEWPHRLIWLIACPLVVQLCLAAWRWSGGELRAGERARGLLLWWGLVVASILVPPLVYSFASRLSVALPGMDWEYVRAPEDAPRLVVFVVLGAVVAALRLGAPLAALIATVRTLMLRRWRRVRQHA